MRGNSSVQRLYLVRMCCSYVVAHVFFQFFLCFVLFPPSPPLIRVISQQHNNIGADGARAVADFMRGNSSVQILSLVRWCHFLILLLVL